MKINILVMFLLVSLAASTVKITKKNEGQNPQSNFVAEEKPVEKKKKSLLSTKYKKR